MIILGLDQAQNCGFAIYDTNAPLSAIRVGVIKAKQAKDEEYEIMARRLGNELMLLIKREKPDVIAMERPLRRAPGSNAKTKTVKFMGEEQTVEGEGGYGGLNAVISSNQLAGAVAGVVGAFNKPLLTLPDSTWRKSFLGMGRQKGWAREDWKRASRQRCRDLKITVTNDDQADAVGVAFAASCAQEVKAMMMGVRV